KRRLSMSLRSDAMRGRNAMCLSRSRSRSRPGAISINSRASLIALRTARSLMKTAARPSFTAKLIAAPRGKKVPPGREQRGVARSPRQAEFRLNRDGSATMGARGYQDETLRRLSLLHVAQAPKLKAFLIDCFLDHVARQSRRSHRDAAGFTSRQ